MSQRHPIQLRYVFFTFFLTVCALIGSIYADFNSKDARDAGFAAEDGEYMGEALDELQDEVDSAIQTLKDSEGGGDEECEMGLMEMNMNHRICKEGGTSSNGATTLPDGMAGNDGDGINVSPGYLGGDTNALACVLIHEWVHVDQTGPYPELPAYEAQKQCLEDLGEAGTAEHEFVCCQVAELKGTKEEKEPVDEEPVEPKVARSAGMGDMLREGPIVIDNPVPVPAPTPGGFKSLRVGSTTFFINQSETTLKSFLSGDVSMTAHPLTATVPFNMIFIDGLTGPSGGLVVAVSGRAGNGSQVEYLEVDPASASVVQALLTVSLPGTKPLSLSDENFGGLGLLYVLDTSLQQIHLLYDGDGDGLAETLLPQPWASSQGHPALANAQSIYQNVATPLSLMVSPRDRRIEHYVDLQETVTVLADLDADGLADAVEPLIESDLVAVIPWPLVPPAAGDNRLLAFGTEGSTLELWQSDAAGNLVSLLGTAVVPDDLNQVLIGVGTPFASGDYLLLRDATIQFADPPVPFQVP